MSTTSANEMNKLQVSFWRSKFGMKQYACKFTLGFELGLYVQIYGLTSALNAQGEDSSL